MADPEYFAAWMAPITLIVVPMAEKVNSNWEVIANKSWTENFQGKYCCLNGSNSPNCDAATKPTRVPVTYPTVRTTKFKGPLYLPQSTIKTTRVPYVTQTYTYGSPATFTYKYNWTNQPWSRDPRQSTVTYTTTTTPKYSYEGPSNRLSYAGEDDNSV